MRIEPVDAEDLGALTEALRRALDGDGPAVGLGAGGAASPDTPDGTAVVVTTSGSTGVPKSVALSADALRASAEATLARVGRGSWLLALPAGYVAGLQVLIRSILQDRAPVVVRGRFSSRAFADAALTLPDGAARFTSLVPAQVATLLDAAASDPLVDAAIRSFDAVLVGGQSLPAALRERAGERGMRIVRTYGSTETSGGCVYDGVPLDGVALRIEGGEIQLAGPVLATGYVGDPPLTDAVFIRDADGVRWYRTGDAGVVEDGVLTVRGRLDNVIVSGGINISLDRVEQVVRTIRGLEQAVVVGVPDERWGEGSVVVAPRGEAERPSELLDDARSAVAAELGVAARPARIVLVDEIDLLPSGKPDRARIRDAVRTRT